MFGFSLSMLLLLAGVAMILAEAVIPGAHFIVLGVATFLTGLVGVLTPAGDSVILLTLTFGAASVVTYLGYSRLDIYGNDGSGVMGSSDSEDLVGKEGEVIETVKRSSGKIDLDDTVGFSSKYQARSASGQDIEVGTRVIVTDGRGGSVVEVEEIEVKEV